jgi:hypothetical protein
MSGRANLFGIIPGYRKAVQLEFDERREAFLDLADDLAGVEVRPFTLRHALILESIGSPFLCGGVIAPADVAIFLWVISKTYLIDVNGKERVIAQCRDLPFEVTCQAIHDYLDAALADSPAGGKAQDSCVAWPAQFVDTFAREYGWSDETILQLPFKRANQYLRCIVQRYNPKAIFIDRSDRVRGEWLQRQNVTGTEPIHAAQHEE